MRQGEPITLAGLSKVDITCFEPDMVMLGWGQLDNRVQGVRTPLFARALVLRRGEDKVVMVAAELCIISIALRQAVVDRVAHAGFGPHDVLLAATHTHSGPSGYSHFLAYNASSFGYSKVVFDTLVDRLSRAILEADARREPAELRIASATIDTGHPVAFNRSPLAYNQNRDTEPIDPLHPERATHRETITLRVDSAAGEPLGAVNWFGVHGSSVHADNRLIDADNKGLAAAQLEAKLSRRSGRPFVSLFFQEAAGDVSPNFRYCRRRGLSVGTRDDDPQSASDNALIQVTHAMSAYEAARVTAPLRGRIAGVTEHIDFSAAYSGRSRTSPPVMGLGMAAGTAEGPGPLHAVAPLLRAFSRLSARDRKIPWLSTSRGAGGRFLGIIPTRWGFHVVAPIEARIAFIKAADDAGFVGEAPWLPRVLPVQVLRLGELVIGAVPFEPTTVAGRRLRRALGATGGRSVLTTYANGYGGYAATPEEYRLQHYEGGATHFGEHTLDALVSAVSWLARSRAAPTGRVFGPALELLDESVLVRQRRVGDAVRTKLGLRSI